MIARPECARVDGAREDRRDVVDFVSADSSAARRESWRVQKVGMEIAVGGMIERGLGK